jgi:hypothetical protein
MNRQKQLNCLLENDINHQKISHLNTYSSQRDTSHLERRKQQRAINNDMIKIALLYGKKHHNKGAILFTITDRSLKKTPYFHYTEILRGLTVVCINGLPTPQILTVYWHFKTKQKVRR